MKNNLKKKKPILYYVYLFVLFILLFVIPLLLLNSIVINSKQHEEIKNLQSQIEVLNSQLDKNNHIITQFNDYIELQDEFNKIIAEKIA